MLFINVRNIVLYYYRFEYILNVEQQLVWLVFRIPVVFNASFIYGWDNLLPCEYYSMQSFIVTPQLEHANGTRMFRPCCRINYLILNSWKWCPDRKKSPVLGEESHYVCKWVQNCPQMHKYQSTLSGSLWRVLSVFRCVLSSMLLHLWRRTVKWSEALNTSTTAFLSHGLTTVDEQK